MQLEKEEKIYWLGRRRRRRRRKWGLEFAEGFRRIKNSLYINVTITEYILQNLKYRADWQIYTKTVKK